MSKWDIFESKISSGVESAASGDLKDYVSELRADSQAFIEAAKNDLEVWTNQLATGLITKDEFSENVQSDADLAKLATLTDTGIALIILQNFRDTLINIVIDAAFSAFL